jgi:hypothetical protein
VRSLRPRHGAHCHATGNAALFDAAFLSLPGVPEGRKDRSALMLGLAPVEGFARDCVHWTEQAKDASERDTLIGIAQLWLNVAARLDRHITLANDGAVLLRELRAKLD